MSPDDDGILGNLPRSRPGRRSTKRPAEHGPQKAGRAPATAGRAPADRSPGARPSDPPPEARSSDPPPEARSSDPLTGAARAAGQLAGAGLRTASRLAGQALGRLPRP